jgi:hypothetical protein
MWNQIRGRSQWYFGFWGSCSHGGADPVVQIYSVSLRLTRLKDMKLSEAVDFSSREVLKYYLL